MKWRFPDRATLACHSKRMLDGAVIRRSSGNGRLTCEYTLFLTREAGRPTRERPLLVLGFPNRPCYFPSFPDRTGE
jgi:hypothetical protein